MKIIQIIFTSSNTVILNITILNTVGIHGTDKNSCS